MEPRTVINERPGWSIEITLVDGHFVGQQWERFNVGGIGSGLGAAYMFNGCGSAKVRKDKELGRLCGVSDFNSSYFFRANREWRSAGCPAAFRVRY